jgi:hypothetical protein
MAPQDAAALDLLRLRVERVAAVSALTSKALKLAQAVSGMEMDILRLELAIGRDPADAQLVQELHEVESNAETVREAQTTCADEIAAAEEDVTALDRQIAAAKGG